MEEYQMRLKVEYSQLDVNTEKLGKYLKTVALGTPDLQKTELMKKQYKYMQQYRTVLRKRCELENIKI